MSGNFQQIHPVITNDNWCQSWSYFPELNPNSDYIIETDLMSPIFYCLLTSFSHKDVPVKNLQVYKVHFYYI